MFIRRRSPNSLLFEADVVGGMEKDQARARELCIEALQHIGRRSQKPNARIQSFVLAHATTLQKYLLQEDLDRIFAQGVTQMVKLGHSKRRLSVERALGLVTALAQHLGVSDDKLQAAIQACATLPHFPRDLAVPLFELQLKRVA